MKNQVKSCAFVVLFMLCSCGSRMIDEKYAASVVKDTLSLPGIISAQELKSGSGAKIFLTTDGQKKYIVRFIEHKLQRYRKLEINNLKIASKAGYAPQIFCADYLRGVVIMEYLSGKMVPIKELFEYLVNKSTISRDLQSDQFYVALAHLLQKIHQGQPFEGYRYDVFKKINTDLQINKAKYGTNVPLIRVEQVINVIHQALLPHLTIVPCHNDLDRENLLFYGNEFKAIDYEDAGPGDPYFDLASIIATFYIKPAHENFLFTTYLGRQPSAVEEARLYLMKQVALIKCFFDDLNRLSPEIVNQYGDVKAPLFIDLVKEFLDGKFDLNKPENKLKFLKSQINSLFDTVESQEFRNAVNVLSGKV